MNSPTTSATQSENPGQNLQRLQEETGAKMEITSGVPVFTVEAQNRDETLLKIIDAFGENTILRIINSHFVKDAIEFGTDRINIDEHDFRSIIHYITGHGYGHDFWGVEETAKEMGLTSADVFCGTACKRFKKERAEGYNSAGLGIPTDRSAVLIFDESKLKEIEYTDGYVFTDPKTKKEALLAIIKFPEQLFEFETALNKAKSINDKITILENEIAENMNTTDDLRKAFYLALNIVTLLTQESEKNSRNPSPNSIEHINRLKNAVKCLKRKTEIIAVIRDFIRAINDFHKWLKKIETEPVTEQSFIKQLQTLSMPKAPDRIIQNVQEWLGEETLNSKHRAQLEEIIKEAEQCKRDLQAGKTNRVNELLQRTTNALEDILEE